jgi:hypothetical protein
MVKIIMAYRRILKQGAQGPKRLLSSLVERFLVNSGDYWGSVIDIFCLKTHPFLFVR